MIVVDTSALMAIALDEPGCDACAAVLEAESDVLISAGTLAETLIVSGRRGLSDQIERLVAALAFTVVPVTEAMARRASDAFAQWGKGVHPASLNLGDCFAYALAKDNDCPLLYVGHDFARTDLTSAI
ncbi:type II toxin-antitoxin system VapC family toxin [soil metagenome]